MDNTYHIVISASESYMRYGAVTLQSFINNHKEKLINFYIFYIDSGVLKYEKIYKQILNNHQNVNIIYTAVKHDFFHRFKQQGWAIDLWARWYLFNYFKANINVERCLVLGVDTYVKSNIDDFYFQDMKNYIFSACSDMWVNNTSSYNYPKIAKDMMIHELFDKKKYINGDVVLVNLTKAREVELTFDGFIAAYEKNNFTCMDQDVITYCFNEYISFQDYKKYNYFPNLEIANFNDNFHYQEAKIVQFAGAIKPWFTPICKKHKLLGHEEWFAIANSLKIFTVKDYLKCLIIHNTCIRRGYKNLRKLLDSRYNYIP